LTIADFQLLIERHLNNTTLFFHSTFINQQSTMNFAQAPINSCKSAVSL